MKKRLYLLLSIGLFAASTTMAMHETEELAKQGMPSLKVQKNNQLLYEKSEALNAENNSQNIADLHKDTAASWLPNYSKKDGFTWPATKTLNDGTKVTVHKKWSGTPVKTVIVHPADQGDLKINSTTEITHNDDGTHTIVNTVSADGYNTTESSGNYQNNGKKGLTGHVSEKKYINSNNTTTSIHDKTGALIDRSTRFVHKNQRESDSNFSDNEEQNLDNFDINASKGVPSASTESHYNTDGSYTKVNRSVKPDGKPQLDVYHADSKQAMDQGKIQSHISRSYDHLTKKKVKNDDDDDYYDTKTIYTMHPKDETAEMFPDSTKPYSHPDNQQGKLVQKKTVDQKTSLTSMVGHQRVLPEPTANQPAAA